MAIDIVYKRHAIHATAVQLIDSGRWEPRVTVIEIGVNIQVTLREFIDTFPTKTAAQNAGYLLAQKWIDDGKPPLKSKPKPRRRMIVKKKPK